MGSGRGKTKRTLSAISSDDIRERVLMAAPRIAELGKWPDYIPPASLTERVPTPELNASGFDAGIACSLDLIPRDRQRLAACLHAAYTPAVVAQVRAEAEEMDPDSETAWWLAACSICVEWDISVNEFQLQLKAFQTLADDPDLRLDAASNELEMMRNRYEMRDGIAFATEDGGAQGAYLGGHEVAGMYAAMDDLYFLSTFQETLGLEDFPWSDEVDEVGRPKSGPVHGSRQYVKCANLDEYQKALAIVKARFNLEN